jgi:hypothetical protein
MRIVLFIVSALTTLALIVLLNTSLTIGGNKTPRFGNFFSPNNGFWQNAEPTNTQFNDNIPSNALKGKVEVFLTTDLFLTFMLNRRTMYTLFKGTCMPNSGYGKWNFKRMLQQEE